jgi:hypothetical protein
MPRKDYYARIKVFIASNSKIECGKARLSSLLSASDAMSKLVKKLEDPHDY